MDDEKLQQRIAMYDDRLNGKILAALKLDPHIALAKEEYVIGCSHTIFTMRPCRMQQYKYVSIRPVYGLASPEIGRRIGQATTAISLNDARRMYEFLLQQGETKTYAGWIFEARMHLVFQRGGRFKATKLGGSATITIAISAERWQVFSKVSDLGDLLRKKTGSPKINEDVIGGYFKPQNSNLCAVDAFAVIRFKKKPVLALFQMTVSPSHPVKAQGLLSIWEAIPAQLKETQPILVFVVPADVVESFSSNQRIVATATETPDSDPPDFDAWPQYALPVSAETLWQKTTPAHSSNSLAFLSSWFTR